MTPALAPLSERVPVDQAARLRAMPVMAEPARQCPVVAITSGKGGVGKTTVSVSLAIALARSGARVVLLDADLGLANADLLCGLTPTTRLDAAIAHSRHGMARSLADLALPAPGGFRLVPGAAGVASVADLSIHQRDRLIASLTELTNNCDILLVDTGAGLGDAVTSFVRAADVALIVTTPEPTSLADGYAMLKCLRTGEHPRLAVFMNQAASHEEGDAASRRLLATCGRFLKVTPTLVGTCTSDPAVPTSVRKRTPVLLHDPKCGFSKELERSAVIVRMLAGLAEPPVQSVPARRSFWRVLFG